MFFNPAPSSGSDSSYNLLFKLIKIRIGFPSNSIYEDIRVKVAFGDLRTIGLELYRLPATAAGCYYLVVE